MCGEWGTIELLGGAICSRCGTVVEVWPVHPITGQRVVEPSGEPYAAIGLNADTRRAELGLQVTPHADGGATVRVCCHLRDGAHDPACAGAR
jgi:hypothetical protein